MPDITKLPPFVQYLVSVVIEIVVLLLSLGYIQNRTEKLIAGLAAIVIPAVWFISQAIWNLAHARVTAARILAGQPTSPRLTP